MSGWRKDLLGLGDALVAPGRYFSGLTERASLRPAGLAMALTTVLFAATTVLSHLSRAPLPAPPVVPLPNYRVLEAVLMPLLVLAGCGVCAGAGTWVGRLLAVPTRFRTVLAFTAPALLVPVWLMLWPTELAVTLGALDPALPGFPGLWVRELAPGLTVCYQLVLLGFVYWQGLRVLLREAFILAVFSLLPALGWWALVLR